MQNRLSRKLTRLREEKGVTLYAAANAMPGMWKRTLQRLENGEAQGDRTPLKTVLTLVMYYWPKLKLSDFTENPELRILTAIKRTGRK